MFAWTGWGKIFHVITGAVTMAVALAGSPLGVGVFGEKVAAILAAVGGVLAAIGQHNAQTSAATTVATIPGASPPVIASQKVQAVVPATVGGVGGALLVHSTFPVGPEGGADEASSLPAHYPISVTFVPSRIPTPTLDVAPPTVPGVRVGGK